SADQEMRDPALVLRAHLPLTVNAAHAEDDGGDAKAAAVIENILVSAAFGAAVWRVEVERPALVDSTSRHQPRWFVAIVGRGERQVAKIAVNLVGRGEDYGNARFTRAYSVKHVDRAAHIHVEVLAGIVEAGRHRDLRRHVEHRLRLTDCARDFVLVARVADNRVDALAVTVFQPLQIALDTRPRERVIDDDVMALPGEPVSEVAADEAGATGDENRPAVRLPSHATSPLISSSARASSTWSSAVWPATHSASSASPSSKSFCARKPRTSAALPPSQKQWRMSPTRALPVISGSMSSRPSARAIDRATSFTLRSTPEPMLNTCASARGCTSASANAR